VKEKVKERKEREREAGVEEVLPSSRIKDRAQADCILKFSSSWRRLIKA
jgi:hypothetical protein